MGGKGTGGGKPDINTTEITQRLFRTFTINRDQNQLHSLRG